MEARAAHSSSRLGLSIAAIAALLLDAAPAAALDEAPCRLESPALPAVFAQCATLTVPARHAEPEGATVELFVARVPALSSTPEPDPLVLIAGGPGGSAVDFYLQLRGAFEPARRERDILLLDQRGTGRSSLGAECELPEGIELETAGLELLETLITGCLEEVEVDIDILTTSEAVRDLERLRRELGVAQWNLYGVSYGTRVAQHYLRRHKDAVRAVILDGVVPAALALGPDIAPNAQLALDGIWQRCAASLACSEQFGDLERRFERLRRALEAERRELTIPDPVLGRPTDALFGLDELRAVVRLMSYSSATVAVLPLVIAEAERGNFAPLAGQAQIVVQGLSESLSFPMHNTVVCSEDVPFYGPEAGRGNAGSYLGDSVQDALEAICAHWPQGFVDPDFKSPVKSDRPVLLLSGEHDPVTPPRYAEQVISDGLGNAVHVVGPAQGHGLAAIGCVPRLIRAFLNAPDPAALDTNCVVTEPAVPFFVTFQGPTP